MNNYEDADIVRILQSASLLSKEYNTNKRRFVLCTTLQQIQSSGHSPV
jgi:hypothetical protein